MEFTIDDHLVLLLYRRVTRNLTTFYASEFIGERRQMYECRQRGRPAAKVFYRIARSDKAFYSIRVLRRFFRANEQSSHHAEARECWTGRKRLRKKSCEKVSQKSIAFQNYATATTPSHSINGTLFLNQVLTLLFQHERSISNCSKHSIGAYPLQDGLRILCK